MYYYIYIITNKHNTALYVGITGNIEKRIQEHKAGIGSKFCKRYKIQKLVYYEIFSHPDEAIAHEKQLKAGSRKKKLLCIESINSEWNDLYTNNGLISIW